MTSSYSHSHGTRREDIGETPRSRTRSKTPGVGFEPHSFHSQRSLHSLIRIPAERFIAADIDSLRSSVGGDRIRPERDLNPRHDRDRVAFAKSGQPIYIGNIRPFYRGSGCLHITQHNTHLKYL